MQSCDPLFQTTCFLRFLLFLINLHQLIYSFTFYSIYLITIHPSHLEILGLMKMNKSAKKRRDAKDGQCIAAQDSILQAMVRRLRQDDAQCCSIAPREQTLPWH